MHPKPNATNAALAQVQLQFQQALALHSAGQLQQAKALCEAIVSKVPRHGDALHLLGIIAYQSGDHRKSVALIDKAIKIYPDNAGFYSNRGLPLHELGQFMAAIASYDKALALKADYAEAACNRANALKELKQFEAALAGYDRALDLKPTLADAYFNRGVTLQQLNLWADALASYDRALALGLEHAEIYYNYGNALHDLGRFNEATAAFDRAIAFQPAYAEAHCNRGNALEQLGQWPAAIASYDRAIALVPNVPSFHGNRGNALQKMRKLEDAVESYDRSLALKPDHADAHFNRAIALQKLGRVDEAIVSYEKALALAPNHADVHYNLGLAFKELGRADEALASQDKALELQPDFVDAKKSVFWIRFAELKDPGLVERLSGEIMTAKAESSIAYLSSKKTISDFRLLHDLEQAKYLLAAGYQYEGLAEAAAAMAQANAEDTPRPDPAVGIRQVLLSDSEIVAISRFRRIPLRYHPAPVAQCLNPENDWAAIEEQYFASKPEIIHIDNLLSPAALTELRTFCLVSKVWSSEYHHEYLGAFAEDGFVSALHFQIALELRQKMPQIFGEHVLEHLWGFKYTSRTPNGINVHADFARVNLNFWVTPDDANLDPTTGGLVVYDVPSPPSWSFKEYNASEDAIYEFLKRNGAGKRRIPYRCNRAVLFNSRLFHETDDLHFKDGYENRRVNVTYLFGRRLKTH